MTIDAKDGFAGLFAGRDNSNSTGRVEIRGATARMDILSTSNTGITIGRDATSTGQLLVTDGALVNLGSPASAFLSIGRDADARGEVTISGGARLDMSAATDSDVTVGAAVIALGRTAGGSGKLDIFGAGAALRVVDQVIIGAPVSLGGGTGDGAVTVRDGGALTARQVLLGAGGTLAGNGTIAASVVVDGGTVTPGTSPGTLHVQDGLKVASGRLHFEIGGIEPGQSDLIEVSGVLELLGGIVEIEFIGGFVPSPSDSITLFDAGGGIVSDGSTSFAFAGLPAGVNLGVTIDPTGQVSVSRALDETEIPAPGGVTLMAIALAMLGARRHAQPAGLSR